LKNIAPKLVIYSQLYHRKSADHSALEMLFLMFPFCQVHIIQHQCCCRYFSQSKSKDRCENSFRVEVLFWGV